MTFCTEGRKMIISLFRAFLVVTALSIFSFAGAAFGQSDTKTAEQQLKPGLGHLLGQIALRTCPEFGPGDIEKATEEIKVSKRNIPDPIQQLLEAWLGYSKYY